MPDDVSWKLNFADHYSDFGLIDMLLAAGGGMYVEVFNRVTPLAYNLIKKNKVGETNT
ncbi:unnamed protein product [Eruca vesicaria subsp. sativa]|uniref:Uncharacterized protein n=1 Tax=Eruca vesicaria subsp. sativa TaxID=29727 RepID=A0ABC8LE13_ERUVS|nr:unnamed protein product [Eruca vesicaria subsp. sativa]